MCVLFLKFLIDLSIFKIAYPSLPLHYPYQSLTIHYHPTLPLSLSHHPLPPLPYPYHYLTIHYNLFTPITISPSTTTSTLLLPYPDHYLTILSPADIQTLAGKVQQSFMQLVDCLQTELSLAMPAFLHHENQDDAAPLTDDHYTGPTGEMSTLR